MIRVVDTGKARGEGRTGGPEAAASLAGEDPQRKRKYDEEQEKAGRTPADGMAVQSEVWGAFFGGGAVYFGVLCHLPAAAVEFDPVDRRGFIRRPL